MTPPVVRLHTCFAAEAPRAVILRQGPARHFRTILWHTNTDRFEDGQWVKRKVCPHRCAAFPERRHFLDFMLFPEGSTRDGGGAGSAAGIVLPGGSRAPLPGRRRRRLLRGAAGRPPLARYDRLGGRLYRRHGAELVLIRDFTGMSFEPLDASGAATPAPGAESAR